MICRLLDAQLSGVVMRPTRWGHSCSHSSDIRYMRIQLFSLLQSFLDIGTAVSGVGGDVEQ